MIVLRASKKSVRNDRRKNRYMSPGKADLLGWIWVPKRSSSKNAFAQTCAAGSRSAKLAGRMGIFGELSKHVREEEALVFKVEARDNSREKDQKSRSLDVGSMIRKKVDTLWFTI
jgi:hypothetical protein